MYDVMQHTLQSKVICTIICTYTMFLTKTSSILIKIVGHQYKYVQSRKSKKCHLNQFNPVNKEQNSKKKQIVAFIGR